MAYFENTERNADVEGTTAYTHEHTRTHTNTHEHAHEHAHEHTHTLTGHQINTIVGIMPFADMDDLAQVSLSTN